MFAVIYRGYLKVGREAEYLTAWKKVAQYFIEERGAIGSSLHRAEDGLFVAYSRWPDKKTRNASWPGEKAPSEELPPEICQAIIILKECLDPERAFPEICMEVVEDLLFVGKS